MLINRRLVREFALAMAKGRAHKFTRVGRAFYLKCEANLKSFIRDQVARHPSAGKTIK